MNWLQALVLGAVQGLTEFLPVSSDGHLKLFQAAMNVTGERPLLDVLMHVGTLAAVCIVFRKDIIELLKRPLQPLTLFLVVATLPAVAAQLLFGDYIDGVLRYTTPISLAIGFFITSLLMYLTPLFKNGIIPKERTGIFRSLLIGIAQVIAIHPSISRSGSTIFSGVATGMKREDVAHFSFLMSIPAILGGVVVEMWKIQKTGLAQVLEATSLVSIIIAVAMAAVTGYLALKIVIDTIKHGKLWVFGVYTTALGLMILFDANVTHFINWSVMSFS